MYLTRKHFLYMLGVATMLHLTAAVAWMLSPGLTVNQVPVHVLNIKLGSGDMLAQREAPEKAKREETATSQVVARQEEYVPPPREDSRVETAKVEAVADETAKPQPKASSQTPKQAAKREGNSVKATSSAKMDKQKAVPQSTEASQYVRRTGDRAGRGVGSAIGNTTKNAEEVMNRYTQLISMWIQRHKVYPEAMRARRIQGKALIRIRIDRLGNILLYKLDQSTGSLQLDEAVAQMIRAANPVPPVPVDYPGGNVIEFLIPVSYKVQ